MTTTAQAETKRFSAQLKADGSFTAIVSTPALDHDGDIVLPSAFRDAQTVPLLLSHLWHELPVGKGTVRTTPDDVRLHATFFETDRAQEARQTLKELGDLAEFSIGFQTTDSDHETINGRSVRIIKALDLFEVSMVLRGASRGTGLIGPAKQINVHALGKQHEATCDLCKAVALHKRLMTIYGGSLR